MADTGVNTEHINNALSKAVKNELRGAGWPVYEHYEVREEEGESFLVAPVTRASFFEQEPYKTELIGQGEKQYLAESRRGRSPLKDAMTFYAPLRTPELVLDLADLAEEPITPERALGWAETYGLLGMPDDDVVECFDGFMRYKSKGRGRRESVRRFAEAAGEVRACLRIYEAITVEDNIDVVGLTPVANLLPMKAFAPFGPMEWHIGRERPWLFSVLGNLVQMRLDEYCRPRFTTYGRSNLAAGIFSLSWGFRGLIGAIWLHMAWLLEAESERVKRCRLPDCLRVVRFDPGEPLGEPGLKKNARGKYKTRSDREFCRNRGCKQKYHYRKKAGWPGYP